ncbi:Transcriptional regulator, PadR family [Candidatus Sulfopaludibacter sp. SbA3]|nr:Transcriptional regulator, PadR family [Candidatus Sulfopaludibacter sp. SbA3]
MPNRDKADVLRGTLDLMILQTVATLGPLHGYAVAERLEQVSSGAIQLNMGTLYPGLLRLEQQGLIRAQWNRTENNRRARYYSLTAAGRRRLDAEKAEWTRMASIMQALLLEEAK